jgi:AAA domain
VVNTARGGSAEKKRAPGKALSNQIPAFEARQGVQVRNTDVIGTVSAVNTFAIVDTLTWREIAQIPDEELSECKQLSPEEISALSDEERDAMEVRDRERLLRKYCGRDPDELAEERNFDPSSEPAWFQELWAIDLSKLTTAELEWRRRNKWDRGTSEVPIPRPDFDYELDDVSDDARRFWHRRVHAMTRDEFEQAYADSKNPRNIAHFLLSDIREIAELAIGWCDRDAHKALVDTHNARIEAVHKLTDSEAVATITQLEFELAAAKSARAAKFAEWRRKNDEREEAQQMAQVIPLSQPDPTRGYEALKRKGERHGQQQADPCRIIAEPFVLRPTSEIPPREWLYGRHLIRKFLSATFAPGAGGKTSLILAEALSMVTGRDLLKVGKILPAGLRVWVWNGEDPKIEIERRVAAICKHYGITAEQLAGRLYVNSGRDTDLKIAVQDRNGTRIAKPDVERIIEQMKARQIDVLIIDPAVSFHSVPENDNSAIDAFAKEWAYIADKTNAAAELAHHVRKGAHGTNEYFVEDGRGAGALLSAARDARVLNFMTPEQALSFGIDGADVLNYFRVDGGKPNMAARSEGRSRWYKIESVGLGNKTELHDADEVGVVTGYLPTAAADAVPNADLIEIAKRLDAGWHGENVQAKDWAGYVVAEVMNLHPKRDKMKVGVLLKTWIKNGNLKVVDEYDERARKDRPFVKGGLIIDLDHDAKPAKPASAPAEPRAPEQPAESEAASASPAAPSAGIPFMMTKDVRRRLNALGFAEEQIDGMSPAMAWQILSVAG